MRDSAPLIQMLLARLERISADSPLAHRASGVRGALIKSLERQQVGTPVEQHELDRALDAAFAILRQAASELRVRG